MGIKTMWKLVEPSVDRQYALSTISVQHGFLARPGCRTYRLGVDASVWLAEVRNTFLARHARYGRSPELRTLLFRLMRLLAMTVAAVFVFDGPQRPSIKRGTHVVRRTDWLEDDFMKMIRAFGFDVHAAPGEAGAELAKMQQLGLIDVAVTDDSDIFVFGASAVIRSTSLFGKVNKADFYQKDRLTAAQPIGFSRGVFVLIALLCGGDYGPVGLPGCGITTAYGLAGYNLGEELCNAVISLHDTELTVFLDEWRDQLRLCLLKDPKGYIGRRHPALAAAVPCTFPDPRIATRYICPVMTDFQPNCGLAEFRLPDITSIAQFCELNFMWSSKARLSDEFRLNLWPGLLLRLLINDTLDRDGVAGNKAFGKLLTWEIHAVAHSEDVQLRVAAGTVEKVIASAVLGIWGAERVQYIRGVSEQVMQELDDITLDNSATRPPRPNRIHTISVPRAVLLRACPRFEVALNTLSMRLCERLIQSGHVTEEAGSADLVCTR
ncbi:PIN domain-like protein [Trametopsis cervina]|nr:PIN domain-like protein [Trametopsis cervina]